ncbi:MAG: hypothetical protein ACPGXZ_00925 [Saprospiraceae bacterium]
MKINIKLLSFVILLAIVSCNKNEPISVDKGESTEIKSPFDVRNENMLNTIALGLIDIAYDVDFRALVYHKVSEQFDNDDNTLLKHLQEEIDLIPLINTSIQNNKFALDKQLAKYSYNFYKDKTLIQQAVEGFVMEDEVWYSQIYIPFMDKHKESNELPTIVVGAKDSEDCIAMGYKLLANKTFEIIEVDEEYAKENLVWVISVNEVVDNEGHVPSQLNNRDVNNNNLRSPELYVTTSEFKVSDKKECWLCGKAEVSIRWANVDLPSVGGCSNNFFNSRVLLSKVGKSDLNDWMTSYQTLVNISNGVTTKLDPNEHILLIMFEYDKNKGLREQIFAPCYHSYYYRSEQSPYIALGVNELEYSDFTNPPNFTFPLTWEYLDRNTGSEYLRIRYRQDN